MREVSRDGPVGATARDPHEDLDLPGRERAREPVDGRGRCGRHPVGVRSSAELDEGRPRGVELEVRGLPVTQGAARLGEQNAGARSLVRRAELAPVAPRLARQHQGRAGLARPPAARRPAHGRPRRSGTGTPAPARALPARRRPHRRPPRRRPRARSRRTHRACVPGRRVRSPRPRAGGWRLGEIGAALPQTQEREPGLGLAAVLVRPPVVAVRGVELPAQAVHLRPDVVRAAQAQEIPGPVQAADRLVGLGRGVAQSPRRSMSSARWREQCPP